MASVIQMGELALSIHSERRHKINSVCKCSDLVTAQSSSISEISDKDFFSSFLLLITSANKFSSSTTSLADTYSYLPSMVFSCCRKFSELALQEQKAQQKLRIKKSFNNTRMPSPL